LNAEGGTRTRTALASQRILSIFSPHFRALLELSHSFSIFAVDKYLNAF